MAIASEVQSLNDINYKSKFKMFLLICAGLFLFVVSFLNFYPIGDRVKSLVKSSLPKGCSPDYQDFYIEWLMPKVIITDLVIPPGCMQGASQTLSFSHVTVNWHLINFAPFGLPFRVDTEFSGQPISVYLVQSLSGQMVRLKDQKIKLSNFKSFFGNKEISGNMVVDMSLSLAGNAVQTLSLKAQSKDLKVPAMNLMDLLNTPPITLNDFFLEASSTKHPRVNIDKVIIGDTNSEIRASFKGKIDLQEGQITMSPMDITGEVAFSENFLKKVPIDMVFGAYTQKDGFYQMRIGGTLGQPSPAPL